MSGIFARKALIQKGWANNVRLSVLAGRIETVQADTRPEAQDIVAGVVIPGLANAHSHAFQRALAGKTEQRSPAGRDNFWTWRERMYALAGKMDAEALAAIARQAYDEMLASGYTSVAEFHYLHREPGAATADDRMFVAIREAARQSGIRLTYVPVLYERAGFDRPDPEGHQALFALDVDRFLEHYARAADQSSEIVHIGIGAHSLRAVPITSLRKIDKVAERDGLPLHLHIAEQQREVDECLSNYGRRPVRWLLENFDIGERWCLVHATHMDQEEVEMLAASGAVVCLCPSTEANLGDGLFPLHRFLESGGRIAIGSDSHVSINPFEELRWLEYGQRLASQSRNVASLEQSHVGRELFMRALEGGAQACGHETAGIVAGARADIVVLYDDDPMLVGHDAASLLDALVFSGYRLPIERVMVNGEWRVIDGEPVGRDEARRDFANTLQRIGAGS
ncbi:MAG: formimidoylglutamate deiminase [Woeseiaceae bacterium]|nr:formimidoylglutamate deiminase [Woeseiaceae bacterium]NIP21847.1 formimidoylglutamate deiminase [Woeseiaceae bacterium]NIS90932.1 formimidoylglutamate deiminase [Woeseiaceae bacterium]